ncbi:short transient receptor potential channel 6-like [Ptychodera flava]|uniref:short transient receptor potential channel 6-like n=1 Tax=Ptychodera flava TaxID=63121 RepID=UPI00396A850E
MDVDEAMVKAAFGQEDKSVKASTNSSAEETLFALVENGSVFDVKRFLERNQGVYLDAIVMRQPFSCSALQLAARQDNFCMIKTLLDGGATVLNKPDCELDLSEHLAFIESYNAITSPSYIALTSDDPLCTAFELVGELNALIDKSDEDPFKNEYEKLRDKLEDFSTALMGKCTSTNEVLTLLRGKNTNNDYISSDYHFPTLDKAIENNAKSFTVDPKCQKVLLTTGLSSVLPKWARSNNEALYFSYVMCLVVICGLLQPFLAILCIWVPCAELNDKLRNPWARFLLAFFANVQFSLMYIVTTVSLLYLAITNSTVTPLAYCYASYMLLYAIGFIIAVLVDMKLIGCKRYMSCIWNIGNVALLAYLARRQFSCPYTTTGLMTILKRLH